MPLGAEKQLRPPLTASSNTVREIRLAALMSRIRSRTLRIKSRITPRSA